MEQQVFERLELKIELKSKEYSQDNIPYHPSEQTQTFLKQNGINLIQFPPNSLNPTEQIWVLMKTQRGKKQPKNKQQLHVYLKKVWDNLNQLQIQTALQCFSKG